MIKNFSIWKNDQAEGNQPQMNLSVQLTEGGKSVRAGVLWVKQTEDGRKYFSGKLQDQFTKEDGTTYPGFVLVEESEYKRLKALDTQKSAPQPPSDDDIINQSYEQMGQENDPMSL